MTRKTRDTSRSPAYFPAKSPPSKSSRRRRKTPKNTTYTDDDYITDSTTQSQSQQYPYDESNQSSGDPENQTGGSSVNSHRLLLPPPSDDNPRPLNSYTNIAPFPIFNGNPDECPVIHMTRFVKVSRANNVSSVDDMMRIFPVTLEKEAALWYDLNIEPYPSLSWEEIKSSFLLRLQWLLQRWPEHGIPDTLIQGIFIDGLREDFQQWIIPQKPESLDDVLRLAFTWEQVRSVRSVKTKEFKCGFCDGAHEEKECEIRERMRGLWLERVEKSERDDVAVAAVAAVSGSGSGGDERESEKKKQCQCSKHQCWKKSIGSGSSSVVTNKGG